MLKRICSLIRNVAKDSRGGGFVEYTALIGLVALAGTAAYQTFGGNVRSKISGQATTVNQIPTN